ncbi:hypothetical protein SDC9_27654 [bioreactor metagenome]|uniref:ATP-grasp domain-containing protein n=1 Tax=bioreactor metagenome TaxID=1076179 RepID=A0A644US77_9ZZZZ|nr:sugar-transfer associated ATP-grasp domain-containing protein [Lentimicrobium sp.]MEA5109136.1 sugar-transfer associated ATP-grasp domain-containing protein [Lentimicrobium sp.]
MYIKILLNNSLPIKDRIKNLISYIQIKRAANIAWGSRYRKVFNVHKEFNKQLDREGEKMHKKYWKPFSGNVNISTYRVCNHISGSSNPEFLPEEIFMADIQPSLNNNNAAEYYNNKSLYYQWTPEPVFPKAYIHNIDGEYLNSNLQTISFEEVIMIAKELSYPVVIKPNKDSGGGKDVFLLNSADELIVHLENKKNVIVQEKIRQHDFFNKYNRHGLNTIRIVLYRSVADNNLHVLNTTLRMGLGGSLDNETAGGVFSLINKDGNLNGYALNKFGTKYYRHPDTGVDFSEKIPDIENLWDMTKRVTNSIFFARIISLDACMDIERQWRLVEANVLCQHTIRFAQYSGEPFFNEFTEEVLEYCRKRHWALNKRD